MRFLLFLFGFQLHSISRVQKGRERERERKSSQFYYQSLYIFNLMLLSHSPTHHSVFTSTFNYIHHGRPAQGVYDQVFMTRCHWTLNKYCYRRRRWGWLCSNSQKATDFPYCVFFFSHCLLRKQRGPLLTECSFTISCYSSQRCNKDGYWTEPILTLAVLIQHHLQWTGY